MGQITRKMPSFEGVAAGQTATCRLPIGLTYHQLLLAYSGATLAQLNEVRIIANGKVIQRYNEASRLDSINQFEGRAAAAGIIIADFDRFGCITRASVQLTGLGTGMRGDPTPLSTLAIEVDIDAAAIGPALSVKAVQSAPSGLGVFKQVREFTYNPAAVGDFEISDLPRLGLINKIVIDDSAAGVNSLKIERDGYVVFERDTAENEAIQTDGVRVPQAGYWVYDPTEEGFGSESLAIDGVQDFRLTLDMAAAGSLPVVVEYIGPLQ